MDVYRAWEQHRFIVLRGNQAELAAYAALLLGHIVGALSDEALERERDEIVNTILADSN